MIPVTINATKKKEHTVNEIVVDHKGATRASEDPATTRGNHSYAVSPSTANAIKPGMVTLADDFMNEYADVFDKLSKREA